MTAIARQACPADHSGAKGRSSIERVASAAVGASKRSPSNRGWPGVIYAATSTITIAIAALSVTLGLHSVNAIEPVIPLDALGFAAVIWLLGRLVASCWRL